MMKEPSVITYAGVRDPLSPGVAKLKDSVSKYPERVETAAYVAGDQDGNQAHAKIIGERHGRVDAIYAGVRDPESSGASRLQELTTKYPGRVEIVKFVAADKDEDEAIVKQIKEKHGWIDTVIANAAIANSAGQIHEISVDTFSEHFSVNIVGPLVLFQAMRDILKASPIPRFVRISSAVGNIELIPTMPLDGGAYGASKAALNWVTRKIHYENEWLVTFPLGPSSVETDMANNIVSLNKTGNATMVKTHWRSPNEAASILMDIIVSSTREKNGGFFNNVTEGRKHSW